MNTPNSNYQVNVTRSGKWWAIDINGLDGAYSQAKRLDQVEELAREVIGLMFDLPDDRYDGNLHIDVAPPSGATDLLDSLDERADAAIKATTLLHEARKEAITHLSDEGLSLRDIGELTGVSYQRVAQIRS